MGLICMAKTIQVRVDDQLKDSADMLFSSLGLDTSTAIRMFLVASMEAGGIPFAVTHRVDRDSAIRQAVNYRKSGGEFLTAEQSLANIREAIDAGVKRGI
jgi:DNA-damage-inducible protein J